MQTEVSETSSALALWMSAMHTLIVETSPGPPRPITPALSSPSSTKIRPSFRASFRAAARTRSDEIWPLTEEPPRDDEGWAEGVGTRGSGISTSSEEPVGRA